MALYSKRQFADLAKVPTNNLSNYIKRGHVVLHGGKPCTCLKNRCTCLIDSGDQRNVLFLERQGVSEQVAPVPQQRSVRTTEVSAIPPDTKNNIKVRLVALQEEKMERQN